MAEQKFGASPSDIHHQVPLLEDRERLENPEMDKPRFLETRCDFDGNTRLRFNAAQKFVLVQRFADSACGNRADGGAVRIGDHFAPPQREDCTFDGAPRQVLHVGGAGAEADDFFFAFEDLKTAGVRIDLGDKEMDRIGADINGGEVFLQILHLRELRGFPVLVHG